MIHQIRISTKFVSYKDIRKSMSDLKQVYGACIEEGVLNEPELFKDKWDSNCQRYIDPCMTTGLHYHMFHVP